MTPFPTETVVRRWHGDETIVVAATGPSLTPDVAQAVAGYPVVAVSDAWRLIPEAAILYSCDAAWWRVHDGCRTFAGERWSCHGGNDRNDKAPIARDYGVRLVAGALGDTFSTDPTRIHFGNNSGFQAINLALLMGARRLVLVGFDMRVVDSKRHFFGDHPRPLSNAIDYRYFAPQFLAAARALAPDVTILNATPDSALKAWPIVPLGDALAPHRHHVAANADQVLA